MTASDTPGARWGFARSLAFGCVAAMGVVAWQLSFTSLVGAEAAFRVYAVLAACAFPMAIAPSLRSAWVSLAASVPLGGAVLLLADDATGTSLGAALMVAVSRSLMFRAPHARSLALELGLLFASLLAARLLGGGRPLELGVAVWTYCLVQSSYFLLLKPLERAEPADAGDAFDLAHRRASALLEREP